jgi:hypothetical protein
MSRSDEDGRYKIVGIHAYAPHGQLDRKAEQRLNELAAQGWRVVTATGWALILERPSEDESR